MGLSAYNSCIQIMSRIVFILALVSVTTVVSLSLFHFAFSTTSTRPVVNKPNLRIQPARQPKAKKAPKTLDISKLNQDRMRQVFRNDICHHLGAMNLSSEYPEKNWTGLFVFFFSRNYRRTLVSRTPRLG